MTGGGRGSGVGTTLFKLHIIVLLTRLAGVEEDVKKLLVFLMHGRKYALGLSSIDRVIRMVDVTPLPHAPEIVSGVINLHGRVIPVFDIRRRFGLPERPTDLNDQMIVARASDWTVSLVVENIEGVMQVPRDQILPPEQVLQSMEYVEGTFTIGSDIVFIHDLDTFLSLDEKQRLDRALLDDPGVAE